ncbi:MAG: hypothetical protein ACFHHU_00235 [Porticoccaceae bacterium]
MLAMLPMFFMPVVGAFVVSLAISSLSQDAWFLATLDELSVGLSTYASTLSIIMQVIAFLIAGLWAFRLLTSVDAEENASAFNRVLVLITISFGLLGCVYLVSLAWHYGETVVHALIAT